MGTAGGGKRFPLWKHKGTGLWAKKIRGRFFYFGSDKAKALERYERERKYLEEGREPPPVAGGPTTDSDIMILWSLAQLGGAVMLYYGLKGEDVPDGPEAPPARNVRPGPTLGLAPIVGRDAGGLTLTARW